MINLILVFLVCFSQSKIYFSEEFKKGWREHWIESDAHANDGTRGTWGWDAGKWYGDFETQMGMKTMDHKSRYQISADLGETFSNKDKTLIISYTVKFDQDIDCGGGYIKLLSDKVDPKSFNENSSYLLMFGPDVYLHYKRDVMFIWNYNGKRYQSNRPLKMLNDKVTHMYTLIIHPNSSYEIRMDNELYQSGPFVDDFPIVERRYIPDPNAKKPEDWADSPEMPDPLDKKPDDWDDRETIPDPRALKPEGWDEKVNGTWVAPLIANPTYQGEWIPRMLPNPNYKGEWIPPLIENPLYSKRDEFYILPNIRRIAVDVWQVKAGTIFDNFFVGDDIKEFEEFAQRTFFSTMEKEREMYEKLDEQLNEQKADERNLLRRAARRMSDGDEPPEDDD
ncbi:putative Calreticulin [Monocercomonoides exilis]|uniref:putative Calreticulin n=1 Tax=Monocercomonoides exilis TaxID=2049356 RepID=UPI00355A089E|nr:putative Calreticulin [Monocercomonoides exilis]|eukprot:MONOS_8277.1-p1 / transcript=MONOS_8277.1 / gene=MONOS_8277 / organism=Monocercomonoides_exilis_PA203 / gene_product=Calreticulin / transcript_product=Calreticulin / location=Mono_scaffold00308:21269-22639(-) / protein_length=393 / sequence_SO=supercontig / SO=protein_coding / is_pseudo=false